LYYVVLAGYVVLVFFFDNSKWGDFTQALPYYTFYLSEVPLLFEEIEAPFNHSWSLGIEEKFYFVWPFLAFVVMARKASRLAMATGLGLALLAGGIVFADSLVFALFEPYGHILVGAGLAFALHDRIWFERLSFLRDPAVYWLIGLACIIVGVTGSRWAFEMLAPLTALFLGAMVTQPDHPISKMLGWRPLVWLGTLSYAVYLIHPAVLAVGERIFPSSNGRLDDLATLVVGYAGSVAIAAGLHLAVEKPFIKLGKRFDSSRRSGVVPDRKASLVGDDAEPFEVEQRELVSSAARVASGYDSEPIVLASAAGELTVPAGWGQWQGLAPLAAAVATTTGGTSSLERETPNWGSADWETQAASFEQLDPKFLPLVDDHSDRSGSAKQGDHLAEDPPDTRRSRLWIPIVLLGLLLAFGLWFVLRGSGDLAADRSAVLAPALIEGVAVDGNSLVGPDGQPIRLAGVTQAGSEYACVQGWGIFDGEASSMSAAAISGWGFNAVRLPLNEHCWLGFDGLDPAYSGALYRDSMLDYVDILRGEGLAVVLSLSWSGSGPVAADGAAPLPNLEYSVPFWRSLSESVAERDGVLLELYASPDIDDSDCNLKGCERAGVGYVGSQSLVDAIRAAGASNPIIVSTPSPGSNVNDLVANLPTDPLDQLIVGFRANATVECSDPSCWQSAVDAQLEGVAVMATGVGDRSCSSAFIGEALRAVADHGISFFASTWNTWGPCPGGPSLIADSQGTPTSYGEAVKSLLN
ncbi:MAG: acyltransferase family protein, partial [Acidimicrobiales bacterium]